MYKAHTVILTHRDALEQLPMSCTDGQNIRSMLCVFWMHCSDCICSAVCYSEHLNTWPLLKVGATARVAGAQKSGEVFRSHWS